MSDKDKFIAEIYPAAVKISQETGMSKELLLAQAAQETGWGQHVLAGTHNIFNIKASADWKGPSKTFKVWEIENGQKAWKDQDFRVYGSTEEALRDRVKFLQDNPRYTKAGLFDEGTKGDFAKEAAALQKAGYATDPLYAKHLIAVYNGPTMQHAIALAQTQARGSILKQGNHGPAIGALQSQLATLGYTGTRGHSLKVDDNFGADTHHAVEAFQCDHHLAVDGKVGTRTQHALTQALQAKAHPPSVLLNDASHPDHALYQQALAGVREIDAQIGRHSDVRSDNLAAALTVEARREGLTYIDEVALGGNGERAFARQHGAHAPMVHVRTADAVQTSIAQSSAAWVQAAKSATNPPPKEVHVQQHASQAMGR